MSTSAHPARIFIGSSSEGVDIAHHLQLALSKEFEVECWDQGNFQLMKGILECVQAAAEWCDFAIIVVTPDNDTLERGVPSRTPRDNVVFEAGYFVGVLGHQRTFIVQCEEDEVHLPTDLQGATIAKYRRSTNNNLQAALNTVVLPIRDRVRHLGLRRRDGRPRIYANSESGEFVTLMETALANARHVVLIGTGLNILHRDFIRAKLSARVKQDAGFSLEIILADPTSPGVETRLLEEELSRETKVTVGRDGLRLRLRRLFEEFPAGDQEPRFILRLFRHYPTFALLIVDDDFFLYPYGYATLGNVSPVMHFRAGEEFHESVIRFLRNHYRLVKGASVDALRLHQIRQGNHLGTQGLHGFAVYYVPPANTELYRFGTEVVGYDVRAEQEVESAWSHWGGGAERLGFHLTLCDVLYFLNEEEVRQAVEELRMLLAEFSPFILTELQFKARFPDDASLAITVEEPQGVLDVLHFEMVHRFYRRAVASNYTLGLTARLPKTGGGLESQQFRRYLAPYILKAYRPHLTLLAKVPKTEMRFAAGRLQKDFEDRVATRAVEVGRLAVMERKAEDRPWSIREEISLGGPGYGGI